MPYQTTVSVVVQGLCCALAAYAVPGGAQELPGAAPSATLPLPTEAAAVSPAPVFASVPVPMGEATRRLLAQQAQGTQASAAQHALPGPVAQQVYQRYLKSFSHPIPEHLGSALPSKK